MKSYKNHQYYNIITHADLILKQETQGVSKYILLPTSLVRSLIDPLYIQFLIVTARNTWIFIKFLTIIPRIFI